MKLAFVFPGQGSQAVGMGQQLAENFASAKAVLDEVDAALGQDLSGLMANGPIEDLTLTENAQPALMAASLAVMRVLEQDFDVDVTAASFVAGHSLGEYSALAAAGSLSIADAAKLLKLRGQAMQKAVPVGEGTMAALLGADEDLAAQAAAFELSPGGPILGPGMPQATGAVLDSERAAFADAGVDATAFAGDGLDFKGTRRPYRIRITNLELDSGFDEHGPYVRTAFDLPRGSYATVVLREIIGDDGVEAHRRDKRDRNAFKKDETKDARPDRAV